MKRATISLPDDLEADVEAYRAEQEAPPSLTALVQAALRRFLAVQRLGVAGAAGERSEIAEEPGVYELGRPVGGARRGGAAAREPSRGEIVRLEDLVDRLASLPRLSAAEAEELSGDLERARAELTGSELVDPWSRPGRGGRPDSAGA